MDAGQAYRDILSEMKKHISGKEETIELMFVALLANGHALLEGVPGVAKTTMTKSLAGAIDAEFKRIQGTPDLEPRDIVGYNYIDDDKSVKFSKGPVFTNILLVDELNRTQPRTMSALLETLEERQVTISGESMPLPRPFIAFATQNPLKVEGTEQIPKVLADRFLIKIDVDYPSMNEEDEMLRIKEREEEVVVIELPEDVEKYITLVVDATRKDIHAVMGASPRADLAFMWCGKAKALIEGRKSVTREDVKFLAKPVLSHRIAVRATGGIGVHGIIDGIIATLG